MNSVWLECSTVIMLNCIIANLTTHILSIVFMFHFCVCIFLFLLRYYFHPRVLSQRMEYSYITSEFYYPNVFNYILL